MQTSLQSQLTEEITQKRIWRLLLIFGFSVAIYQIVHFVKIYVEYPVIVDLRFERSQSEEFPAVTICNFNRIDKKYISCVNNQSGSCMIKVEKFLNGNGLVVSERRALFSFLMKYNNTDIVTKHLLTDLFMQYFQLDKDALKTYGIQSRNLIKRCSFNGQICYINDFDLHQSLQYGNCFSFNTMRNNSQIARRTFKFGYNSGLEVILNVETHKYLEQFAPPVGVNVLIHDSSETPNVEEGGIKISPGFETSVSVKKFSMLRLPTPYKDKCKDYGKIIKNPNECIRHCIQKENYVRCGCVDPTIYEFRENHEYCNMTDRLLMDCLDATLHSMMNHPSQCYCPMKCLSSYYSEDISKAVWPSQEYFDKYLKHQEFKETNASIQDFRRNFLLLKVYLALPERKIFVQNPTYQQAEFLAYLGGYLSVWVGMSFVTACIAAEILFTYCGKIFPLFIKSF